MSLLEDTLAFQIKALKLPEVFREYPFAAFYVGRETGVKRRLQDAGLKNWRFDFAWPELRLAVEVEGGGWSGGRHTRGKGFREDMDKYHAAAELGWFVYRCDAELINTGKAANFLKQIFDKGELLCQTAP